MPRKLIAAASAAVIVLAVPALGGTVAPDDVAIVDYGVADTLTGAPGDPARGREWFTDRKLGGCIACHANADLADLPFHGNIGPPLDGVADRWGEAELRAIVVNAKEIFGPQTIMPAFYRVSGLTRVAEKFQGMTILTAEQVEDVVAYLLTLKE